MLYKIFFYLKNFKNLIISILNNFDYYIVFNFDNLVSLESYNSYIFLYNLQMKIIVVNIYIYTHTL